MKSVLILLSCNSTSCKTPYFTKCASSIWIHNSWRICLSVSVASLDLILDHVHTWHLGMKGMQPELKSCSGNSTVSDFRLNKGTMFYFYPCLRKDGWLTRTPKLLLVPRVCGAKLRACVRETERGWGAVICHLPNPDQSPDSCAGCLSPSLSSGASH